MIHPTSVIHPQAQVDSSAEIGPYAVIDSGVAVGPGCKLGPHVHLTGQTKIGAGNTFHTGCVIGDAPQDLKYKGAPTQLHIGDHNVFREHVTVNRSTSPTDPTVIGSNNFLMAHSHLGHNSKLGNRVIVANGALIAGHVTVEDHVFISGNCLVHQFVRIGTLALMQGGSAISKDLPPYTIARGDNGLCGLNTVGLRRAGLTSAERMELRQLYHLLFRQGGKLQHTLEEARSRFASSPALALLHFISASKRGICADRATKPPLDPEEPESTSAD